ncbi:MAG: TIGR02757 family protein [Deltaproteobacteria bacterium]|nr:TIGR02757 family protein [Deltaproteobacteria bacterium]
MKNSNDKFTLKQLEDSYKKYNDRKYVHPDPLEFLYNYSNLEEREIAAVIASSLAYGRVAQILKSVGIVLDTAHSKEKNLVEFVQNNSAATLKKLFKNFKHRFTTGDELSTLIHYTGRAILKYSSLENAVLSGVYDDDTNIKGGITVLAHELTGSKGFNSLMPDPGKGSALKRINLMMRWMVREDKVDPGGWKKISPSLLIIPLDTHMHKISLQHGLTIRKSADLKTALEITEQFSKFSKKDPVKYDFALTRPGIGGH